MDNELDKMLEISENRYRSLFEEAPSANLVLTPEGIITDCNKMFLRMLGLEEHTNVFGTNVADCFLQQEQAFAFLERCQEADIYKTEEWQLKRKDQKIIVAIATFGLVYSATGVLNEIRLYLVDVTANRELESQLRQAQKMEAMGRLAGGIAHDFNNIITAIMGYCNLLSEEIGEDARLKTELDGIQTAAKKAVNLTRQLLAFSRKRVLEPRVINVNSALHDLENMARRLVSENITLKFFTESKPACISMDPGQFEQVIINLIVNAKDAVGENGTIIVDTATILSDGSVDYHGISPGAWLLISVRDNGKGIEKKDLPNIFEPFFTTKGLEHGTGLGLSTVYAIITRNGGKISVQSDTGKGTAFYIYLPLAETVEDSNGKSSIASPPKFIRKGQILLVEDDDYLRDLLAKVLTRSGYKVLDASNPGDALLIAEKNENFILLTDVVMPRMNGYELAERLHAGTRKLPVLFMSGYSDNSTEGTNRAPQPFSKFIQKPFSHDQLMEVLDEFQKNMSL